MHVLVAGSGAREHALGLALAHSPLVTKLYFAPGNPGMAQLGPCLPIKVGDLDSIVAAAVELKIDLVVVGPEAPLAAGLADRLRAAGIPTVGPSALAARIESSKAYTRRLGTLMGVPQPGYAICTTMDQVEIAVRSLMAGRLGKLFVKADGLAAGKGAVGCSTIDEALAAARSMLVDRAFGEAGATVLIEQGMIGEEVSFHVLTDGHTAVPMLPAQDYKLRFDGDQGLNTGGMGAHAPAPILTPDLAYWVMERIIYPTLHGMAAMGCPFQGCLYAGLMVVDADEDRPDIRLVEYNCRFGDPETQVILALLDEDLLPRLLDVANGTLSDRLLRWKDPYCATVVALVSDGYPGSYETGHPITGIETAEALEDVTVVHAGTRLDEGVLVTGGGRVLNVVGVGVDFADATDRAYAGVDAIEYAGMQSRHDIGQRVRNA